MDAERMSDGRFAEFLARADLSASLFPFSLEAKRARASESALLARVAELEARIAEALHGKEGR